MKEFFSNDIRVGIRGEEACDVMCTENLVFFFSVPFVSSLFSFYQHFSLLHPGATSLFA